MNILYIDDDPEDREIFKEALSRINPEITLNLAADGGEGFTVLEGLTLVPDLIFVDVNMPGIGGKQFLNEAKRIPGLKTVPIIMYSTTSHEKEMKELFRLGASKVLVKPRSFNKVCELISSVIKSESQISIDF